MERRLQTQLCDSRTGRRHREIKTEAHTTVTRTRLLRVGGSRSERADPGNLRRSWPRPLREAVLRQESRPEGGWCAGPGCPALPSHPRAGSPEKSTGIPGPWLGREQRLSSCPGKTEKTKTKNECVALTGSLLVLWGRLHLGAWLLGMVAGLRRGLQPDSAKRF